MSWFQHFKIDPRLARRIVVLGVPVILAMLTQTAINLIDTAMVGRLVDRRSMEAAAPGFASMDVARRGAAIADLEARGVVPETLAELSEEVSGFATWTPAAKAAEVTRLENESTNGVAALGYSLIMLWFVGGFLSAISVGTQAMAARRFGAGEPQGAGQALSNSLVVATITSVAAGFGAFALTPDLFPLIANAEVAEVGTAYLQPRYLGVIPMVMTASYKSFFDGIGKTYLHFVAAVAMNIVNILLNWCLIWGNLGLPRLEVAGAGWASSISSGIGLLLMILFSLRPRSLKLFGYYRLTRNLDWSVMWRIVRLSFPGGVATLAVMSGFGFFLWTVNRMDVLAGNSPAIFTAATKVIIDVQSVSFMSCIAFGTATATLVGQAMGAGKYDEAERFGWQSVKLGAYVLVVFGATMVAFPEFYLRLFVQDEAVVLAGAPAMRLTGIMEPAVAGALIFSQAHFGAGNSRFVMIVELVLHFLCLIPLAYVAGVVLDLGMLGVWASPVIYAVLLSFILGREFHKGDWKKIKI